MPKVDRNDPAIQGYGLAAGFLDGKTELDEVLNAIGLKDKAREPVGILLMRIMAVLQARRLIGAAVSLALPAKLAEWQPKPSKDGSALRIVLDVHRLNPSILPTLWDVQGSACTAILNFAGKQPQLGTAPPVYDIAALLDQHDAGEHAMMAIMSCPACLVEAATASLEPLEMASEDEEPPEPEEG